MSQVFFQGIYNNRQVEVMAGWDALTKRYFTAVFDLNEAVWNSLREPDIDLNTERLQRQLKNMGLEVPDGFWERVHRQEGDMIHTFVNGKWY